MPENNDVVSQLRGRMDLLVVLIFSAFIGFGFGLILHSIGDNATAQANMDNEVLKELGKLRRDVLILDNARIEAGENGR